MSKLRADATAGPGALLCSALLISALLCSALVCGPAAAGPGSHAVDEDSIEDAAVVVRAEPKSGLYAIRMKGQPVALRAGIAAQVDHRWLRSRDYPRHLTVRSSFTDEWGAGTELVTTHSGLAGAPELVSVTRMHTAPEFLEVAASVHNTTGRPLGVQAIRTFDAVGSPVLGLHAPDASIRVLSDSFSEDRPSMTLQDLGAGGTKVHTGVGSQLLFNRASNQGLFLGALTSNRWLTVLRLHVDPRLRKVTSYEADSTGTTEIMKDFVLSSPRGRAAEPVELSLPVNPGESLASERMMIGLGPDYHAQLERYGELIRLLHHARVTAPTPMGWWSWTAYYHGLNADTALTNAELQAQQLQGLGYNYFHIDEGYAYARGEYTNPDAALFPQGVATVEYQVRGLGLIPGIWTAPFEVSLRSALFHDHQDWLVRDAHDAPLQIAGPDAHETVYALDTTNPGVQDYLRKTFATLVNDWGIRYIKLDFMDDTAVEGHYFRPDTTALEAQRIGLQIIREAVGDRVLLDKDGSPMLNPVGIVDMGRISCDTGHTFQATREAAPGIAARYYMNRNFFVNDPDAFAVSRQTIPEQSWHESQIPITLDEARASIALAAISGGMFEIGDDLPTLFADPDRMALVKNADLIAMAKLGRAATPIDLMTYAPADGMPSVFLLREDARQAVLTLFNWTDKPRHHTLALADLGWTGARDTQLVDVFDARSVTSLDAGTLSVELPAHSARIYQLIDRAMPAMAPQVRTSIPTEARSGVPVGLDAQDTGSVPALAYRWDFGDGTSTIGPIVSHAYTHAGEFNIRLTVEGLDGIPFENSWPIRVSGAIDTEFNAEAKSRYLSVH